MKLRLPRIALAGAAALALALSAAAPVSAASFGRGIWLTQAEIAALPTSGAAWQALKAAADSSWGTPLLSDGGSNHDVLTLAGALVYARTGDEAYRAKVVSALRSIVGTETDPAGLASGQQPVLANARNLTAYVIAADLVGFDDPAWKQWLGSMRTKPLQSTDPASIVRCQEKRANNWGLHCGQTRVAIDAYLGDFSDLARAAQVFRGWLGDRASYAGFSYGSLWWQSNPLRPVGINPRGATILGHDVDGVLPDDQRRAGSFTWPPPKENYVWGALGPAFVEAELLRRAGYTDVYQWSDGALRRAVRWLYDVAQFPAQGDDTWAPWLINHVLGTSYPTTAAAEGKSMAWTDWMFGPGSATGSAGSGLDAGASGGTAASGGTGGTTTASGTTTGGTTTGNSTGGTPTGGGSSTNPGTSGSTDGGAGGGAPAGGTLTFPASADAFVKSTSPTKNTGGMTYLRVRSSDEVFRTYLTFTVTGLSGPPRSATLRLFVTDPSDDGGTVYPVLGAWSESAITWANAPALGNAPLGTLRAPTAGTWIELDLGGLVTGNGTYSLAIAGGSSNSVYYASREAGNGPQLVVVQ